MMKLLIYFTTVALIGIIVFQSCRKEIVTKATSSITKPKKIENGSGKTTNDLAYYKKYYGGRISADSILKTYADSRSTIPQRGLIVWYPFSSLSTTQDSLGNNVTSDSSRNQYDYTGILNSNVIFFADRFGKSNSAYDFEGDGYITVNSSGNNFLDTLGNATNEATVSVWIYLTEGSVGGAMIDNNRDAVDDSGYTLIFDNDNSPSRLDPTFGKRIFPAGLYAQIGTSADTVHNTITHKYGEILYDVSGTDTTFWNKTYTVDQSGNSFPSLSLLSYKPKRTPFNKWMHLVFTYSHGNGTLYVNGKVYASKSGMNPISQNKDKLFIGAPVWEQSVTFQGAMDDIALWNRALSLEEILKLEK